jgi:glutamine phosphoribosylpyrophosphate amidotransferase
MDTENGKARKKLRATALYKVMTRKQRRSRKEAVQIAHKGAIKNKQLMRLDSSTVKEKTSVSEENDGESMLRHLHRQ